MQYHSKESTMLQALHCFRRPLAAAGLTLFVLGCATDASNPEAPYRARGNEPFWALEIGPRMTLTRLDQPPLEARAPAAQISPGLRRYAANARGTPIAVAIFERTCADTMTGMPHPDTVEVVVSGRTYRGCGGDPATLLQGREWRVEDLTGGFITRSRATLNFGADGRLSGRASCNNYSASYRLTGEGLTIGQTAATLMACDPPALAQQERRFLAILQNTARFEITPNGALVLHDNQGRKITARR